VTTGAGSTGAGGSLSMSVGEGKIAGSITVTGGKRP